MSTSYRFLFFVTCVFSSISPPELFTIPIYCVLTLVILLIIEYNNSSFSVCQPVAHLCSRLFPRLSHFPRVDFTVIRRYFRKLQGSCLFADGFDGYGKPALFPRCFSSSWTSFPNFSTSTQQTRFRPRPKAGLSTV